MHEEGNTGEVFCRFFMERLRKEFKKFPLDAKLEFYLDMRSEEAVICSGRRTEWEDARLTAKEKKAKAGWLFRGESPDRTLQYFLEISILFQSLKSRVAECFLQILKNEFPASWSHFSQWKGFNPCV